LEDYLAVANLAVTFSLRNSAASATAYRPFDIPHSSMPPQRGGRPVNQTVANNFQQVIVPGRRNTVQCLHCHQQMAKGASRQQSHLNQCNKYQTRVINRPSPHALAQITLDAQIRPLSAAVIKALHRTAAMAVYMSNLSFNHYENPYVRAHEQVFHSNYIPPSHTAMAGVLLDEAYQTVKSKIDSMLTGHYLNFFSDESTNIRKERVINLCVHVPKTATSGGGGFHLKAEAEVAEIMNAKTQAV